MLAAVVGGSVNKTVERRGWGNWVMHIPATMRFCPRRAGVFNAHALEMKGLNRRAKWINLAEQVVRIRERRIAAGIGGRRASIGVACGIELRQTIKGLIGNSILCPVSAQCAEVAIEGTVLLGDKNNVVNALQAGREFGRNSAAVDGNRAIGARGGTASPSAKTETTVSGIGREDHIRMTGETGRTSSGTINAGWRTGNSAASCAVDSNGQLGDAFDQALASAECNDECRAGSARE